MTRQDRTPDDTREALIDVVLSHVPFDGWSDKALLAAAADPRIDAVIAENPFTSIHALIMDNSMEPRLPRPLLAGHLALANVGLSKIFMEPFLKFLWNASSEFEGGKR